MKQGDLIVGERYILSDKRTVAVYEGKHSGVLTFADGTTFDGGQGALKFRLPDSGLIRLFENGRDIEEPESTKKAREASEAARKARQAAAHEEALAFLSGLGLTVVERSIRFDREMPVEQRRKIVHVRESSYFGGPEDVNDIEVDDVTIGTLRALLAQKVPA